VTNKVAVGCSWVVRLVQVAEFCSQIYELACRRVEEKTSGNATVDEGSCSEHLYAVTAVPRRAMLALTMPNRS
jgi:hypothetical protein